MSAKSFTTAAVAVLLVLVSGQALQVRAQNERWSIFCTDPIGSSAQEVTFVRAAWSAGNNNYRSEGASVSNSNPLNVAPPDCACLDISGLNTGLELSSFVAEINGDDEITGLQGSGSDFEIQPFNGLNPRIPFQGSADGDTLSGYVHFNYPFFPCCDDEADECCDDGGHARDQDTPCTGATGGSGTCNLGVCEVVEPSGDGSSGDGDDDGLNGGGGGLFGGGGSGGALVFAGIGVAVLVVVAVVVAVVCCCRGAGSGYKSSGDVEFVDSSTLTATEALKAEHGTERRPQRIVSHREPPKPPSSESGDNGGDFDPTMI